MILYGFSTPQLVASIELKFRTIGSIQISPTGSQVERPLGFAAATKGWCGQEISVGTQVGDSTDSGSTVAFVK
jgi:hypothetical protein